MSNRRPIEKQEHRTTAAENRTQAWPNFMEPYQLKQIAGRDLTWKQLCDELNLGSIRTNSHRSIEEQLRLKFGEPTISRPNQVIFQTAGYSITLHVYYNTSHIHVVATEAAPSEQPLQQQQLL